MKTIDGQRYFEIGIELYPFGNVCRNCAFYGTACYDHPEIDCHGDSREDGRDVIFKLANQSLETDG